DLDRRFGLDAVVVERAHDLDAGQYAVVAVELAAGRLGVDVAAGHDRGQGIVAAGAAHEAVADLVDGDGHSGVPGPADDQVAALPVQVGERQPADAALGRGADLRQFHERGPQPFAVDAQSVEVGIGGNGRSAHRCASGCIN
ncbi:MAG: rne, partial [Arthrobacter sp.]|nr:rne [Arthrobacter sp.]